MRGMHRWSASLGCCPLLRLLLGHLPAPCLRLALLMLPLSRWTAFLGWWSSSQGLSRGFSPLPFQAFSLDPLTFGSIHGRLCRPRSGFRQGARGRSPLRTMCHGVPAHRSVRVGRLPPRGSSMRWCPFCPMGPWRTSRPPAFTVVGPIFRRAPLAPSPFPIISAETSFTVRWSPDVTGIPADSFSASGRFLSPPLLISSADTSFSGSSAGMFAACGRLLSRPLLLLSASGFFFAFGRLLSASRRWLSPPLLFLSAPSPLEVSERAEGPATREAVPAFSYVRVSERAEGPAA